ncbi:MAG: RNA-binding cell elongation regulator Jag/EloR [Dehalococcoidales bacterium]
MKELEISARTVDEATHRALQQLGLRLDQVEIEIISEGKPGLLGIGAEAARIRVTETANRIPPEEQVVASAQESLETILSYMGLDASVFCQCENPIVDDEEKSETPIVLDINGEDLGILIGRHGQTLACLQYITRLMVTHQTGFAAPLVLDVNGYKKRRYESLRTLAQHVAEQVDVSGRSCALEPMPAYERRIIHLALAEHPYVTTESVGFGDARKVVILPKHP